MGLLLSVLVTCVGVVELLTVYQRVRQRVQCQAQQTSLSSLQGYYLGELRNVRERLVTQLDELKRQELTGKVPTFRLNSHEDIEIEYNKNIVARSRSPSPRRFLVTERKNSTSPTRRFVLSEEPQDIQSLHKSPAQECLPEYLIEEKKHNGEVPRFILKDGEGPVPLPLPEKFVISEPNTATNTKTDIFRKKLGHTLVELDGELYYRRSPSPFPSSFDLTAPRNSICSELHDESCCLEEVDESSKSNSHSPVNIDPSLEVESSDTVTLKGHNQTSYENAGLDNNKSSGRINALLVTSVSSHRSKDFWDNKALLVPHKGNRSKSSSPSPLESEASSHHSSEQYWDNKALEMPQRILKSRSVSPAVIDQKKNVSFERRRSVSESATVDEASLTPSLIQKTVSQQDFPKESNDNISSSEEENFADVTEETMDSLDGIDKKRGCIRKRYLKRRQRNKTKHLGADVSSKETSSDVSPNIKVKENLSGPKQGEPFWLIFSGEYTKAMNKDWHAQHFCCWQCDESLTGQRYVLRDDHPYCVSCYESVFANACEKCGRTIGIDSKDLSYKDKHWHEACFLCTTCNDSLVDKQFGSKGDRIYCGRCYDEQFASRCDGCHEIFRAGTKKMEYKTRQWHEKCFCCCMCKTPIGTQSFIPREQEIYCAKCYEEKYATRCIKCNKVITSGGVTYKNEPWHRECFTCTHCTKSLAGERFTSRDEKPYCAECFGELFAKRCFACIKPITGIGGTKFISFEDRHWHNDCFFCASCRTSLVGRGFITDNEDIICPECAKQKLM